MAAAAAAGGDLQTAGGRVQGLGRSGLSCSSGKERSNGGGGGEKRQPERLSGCSEGWFAKGQKAGSRDEGGISGRISLRRGFFFFQLLMVVLSSKVVDVWSHVLLESYMLACRRH